MRAEFSNLIWLGITPFHMLVGKELIDFVHANESLNQMELAEGAGYTRTTKSGKEQVLVKHFYNALLAAQGMAIPVGKSPGKTAKYETTVHRSGVILLGKTYSQKFGLNPGDGLDIVIEEDSIRLVPQPVASPSATRAKAKIAAA